MNLSPQPKLAFLDNNGNPLVGGKLFTYVAGTSTKQVTYTNSSGSQQNANPVRLDYRGEANLWLDPTLTYKFVLADANDTDPPTRPIWTVDNINGALSSTGNIIPSLDNTFTLGSPSFSWANVYVGADHLPIYNAISGGIGYIKKTNAEVEKGLTISDYSRSPGDIRRYGAVGDGATDARLAILNAIAQGQASAYDAVPSIYIPAGVFLVSATIQVNWSGRALSFVGEGGDYFVDTGSVLKFSGSSAIIFINGSSTWENYLFQGIKFKSTNIAASTFGVRVRDSWFPKFLGCVFEDFSYIPPVTGAISSGIRLEGLVLEALIDEKCLFTRNACGLVALGDAQMNVITIDNTAFYESAMHHIMGGDRDGAIFGFTTWTLGRGCSFEAAVDNDIYLNGSCNNLSVEGAYFEWTTIRSPVVITDIGLSTALAFKSLSFNGEVGAGEGFIHLTNIDGLVVENIITTLDASLTDGALVSIAGPTQPKNFRISAANVPTGTPVPTLLYDGVEYSSTIVDDHSIACLPGAANLESASGPIYTLTPGVDPVFQTRYQPMTVLVTVTLNDPPVGLGSAAQFVINRTAAATGAFNLEIRSESAALIHTLTAASKFVQLQWAGASYSVFANNG